MLYFNNPDAVGAIVRNLIDEGHKESTRRALIREALSARKSL